MRRVSTVAATAELTQEFHPKFLPEILRTKNFDGTAPLLN
jgi:hypothetical protein